GGQLDLRPGSAARPNILGRPRFVLSGHLLYARPLDTPCAQNFEFWSRAETSRPGDKRDAAVVSREHRDERGANHTDTVIFHATPPQVCSEARTPRRMPLIEDPCP